MLLFTCAITDRESYNKFYELYARYHIFLIKVAFCYVRKIEVAEDLVHDVYVKIIDQIDRIPDPGNPKVRGYLFTMVKRFCLSYFADHEIVLDWEEYKEFLFQNADPVWDDISVSILMEKFTLFLDGLEDPDKTLFIDGVVHKHPYGRIAQKLGMSENNVAVRIFRLKGRLQKCLDE